MLRALGSEAGTPLLVVDIGCHCYEKEKLIRLSEFWGPGKLQGELINKILGKTHLGLMPNLPGVSPSVPAVGGWRGPRLPLSLSPFL